MPGAALSAFHPARSGATVAVMAQLPARTKALIYSNLEKYARSGMGMEKACASLLDQPRLARAEFQLYRGLREGIQRGATIADALAGAGSFVTPLEHEVIDAAESGGRLEKGFAHLAEYFRRLDRTRRLIAKGLVYPVVLLHLAIPVSTLAISAFRSFELQRSGGSFDFGEVAMRSLGTMLWLWAALLAVLITGGILARMGRTSRLIDGLLRWVPLLGKARLAVAMERFTQVFEIFLLAGRTMSDSLAGAARASGSGLIRHAGERGAPRLAAGNTLASVIFAASSSFPRDFARGVAAAEESGQLDREFAEWSRYYADSAAESMERLGEWTPKLFYWAVLFLVAWLIIRSALAYKDLLENVLNFGG